MHDDDEWTTEVEEFEVDPVQLVVAAPLVQWWQVVAAGFLFGWGLILASVSAWALMRAATL